MAELKNNRLWQLVIVRADPESNLKPMKQRIVDLTQEESDCLISIPFPVSTSGPGKPTIFYMIEQDKDYDVLSKLIGKPISELLID